VDWWLKKKYVIADSIGVAVIAFFMATSMEKLEDCPLTVSGKV